MIRCSVFAIVISLLVGCQMGEQTININEVEKQQTDSVELAGLSENDKLYMLGEKMKGLSDIPDINTTVILVNGESITKKDIEGKKILCEFEEGVSLKSEINEMIRDKVVVSEAKRLNIKPAQSELDAYEKQTREFLNGDFEVNQYIYSYMNGMGITVDEYIEMTKDLEYQDYQITAWWQTVSEPINAEIQEEAKGRNETVGTVSAEYYEKYVDELMDKAVIEYLDKDIEAIMTVD